MDQVPRLIALRKLEDRAFIVFGLICTLIGIVCLAVLVAALVYQGSGAIDYQFFTSFPSRHAAKAGILPAWVGSLCVVLVTVASAVPLGVATAIYLEEYAAKNWLATLIEINIANLAGVPSIVYGLLALGVFVYGMQLGRTVLVGGLTLAVLVLPIVIVTTREALRAIPSSIREAAYACGATKLQLIYKHLIPYSLGGIATGTIIAISRALGETAPLLVIGATSYITFLPPSPLSGEPLAWLDSRFTVLPIQMYDWVSHPKRDFQQNAAAAGLALICITLTINITAIYLRYRARRNIKW